MKNIVKVWRSSAAFMLYAFSLLILITSCSNEWDEELTPSAEVQDIRIVVSDFPAFDDAQTRAIGTFDSGKTAWERGDVIYIIAANAGVDSQILTLTYGADGQWTADGTTIHYLSATDTHIRAIYAPNCEKEGTEITEKNGYPFGTGEFLEKDCYVENGTLTVDFTGYVRPYSRLRIVTEPNEQIHVTATLFDPAGYYDTDTYNYTLTADEKGNAYLYGKFAANGTVTVQDKDWTVLEMYYFTDSTVAGESYVLDVVGYSYNEQTNTYNVWSAKGLYAWNKALETDLTTNLVLAADITLPNKDLSTGEEITVTDNTPGGSNWNPYGYYDYNVYTYTMYSGTIDGGGHTISGMRINTNDENIGFVKVLGESGSIKNLVIDDVVIYSNSIDVAALAGSNYGIIENCHVKGETSSIYGTHNIGGIAGYMNNKNGDAEIVACSNMATVTQISYGAGYLHGGIVANVSKMSSFNSNVIGCWTKDTNETNGTKDGIGVNNGATTAGVFSFSDATAANSKITEMNQALEDAGYSYRWEAVAGGWPEIKKLGE